MSLRARLLLVVLALSAVGLVAADLATATALRGYLVRRIDQQLDAVQPFITRRFSPPAATAGVVTTTPTTPTTVDEERLRSLRPPGLGNVELYAERVASDGAVTEFRSTFQTGPSPLGAVPTGPVKAARSGHASRFSTSLHGLPYRVDVRPIPDTTDVAVTAVPLHDLNETLRRLYTFEGAATLGVLAVAGLLALWLVRVGLRPLDHMADTADAIASGDARRRVDVAPSGTEVGRLGQAMNAAFDARQASEERLRRFVADASHELRTPLTSIRGYAELFRSGALTTDEDRGRALRRIEDEATRMGGLVDDLLLLARLDQGRPLDLQPVDLAAVAADAAADARAVDRDRPVTLDAPEPVVVIGDESRLRQVLANLLGNVRDHTPAGTPAHIRVAVDGANAIVEVADRGPGLSPEQARHVFDRFWRADPARGHIRGQTSGSGLGLSIVAAVANAHGGRAWVGDGEPPATGGRRARRTQSQPGAHFFVSIPLAPNERLPFPSEPSQEVPSEA